MALATPPNAIPLLQYPPNFPSTIIADEWQGWFTAVAQSTGNLGTLTPTRVPYVGAGGNLQDSASLTSDGLSLNINGIYAGTRGEPESTGYGFRSLEAVDFSGATPSGRFNTAFGAWAMYLTTTGYKNVAFGRACLDNNTTGYYNAGGGYGALHWNVDGVENTGWGHETLHDNVSGINNTAVGSFTLWKNRNSNNTAVGQSACLNNLSGSENTAVGRNALTTNVAGVQNAIVGAQSFLNATGISQCAGLGYGIGATLLTGTNITLIGNLAYANNGLDHATAIGADSVVAVSNSVVLGRAADTVYSPGKQVIGYDPGGSETLRVGGSTRVAHLLLTSASADIYNVNVSGGGTIQGIRFYSNGDQYQGVKAAGSWRVYNGTTLFLSASDTTLGICGTPNGAMWQQGVASELLTLNTGGLTTDTSANLLPANSIIEAVVCRITTALTVTTNWAVGDATISNRFSSANSTLTLGTTSIGLNHVDQMGTSGPKQISAAKVRITCTGSNPGAGAIRITVFYRTFTPPTS